MKRKPTVPKVSDVSVEMTETEDDNGNLTVKMKATLQGSVIFIAYGTDYEDTNGVFSLLHTGSVIATFFHGPGTGLKIKRGE